MNDWRVIRPEPFRRGDVMENAWTTGAAEESGDTVADIESFYADDVPFYSNVHSQIMPERMAFVAALNGFNPPRPHGAFRYCDLGCGNGITANAIAAIRPDAQVYGIDFNQGHIDEARETAEAAGLNNVRFIRSGFESVDAAELPSFDFVGMNGIYSWLDRGALDAVHTLLQQRLRPGGLFCVEFMTMPGMLAVMPLWQLLQALVPPTGQDSRERARRALRILKELGEAGLGYFSQYPPALRAAKRYLTRLDSDPSWIDHFAHNALAGGFQPRYINEVCAELGEMGLTYAGRMRERLNDPDLATNARQATILNGIEDAPTRELLTDFMRNESNRHALFVKEGVPDAAGARDYLLHEAGFALYDADKPVERVLRIPGGREVSLAGPVYDRMVAAMAAGGTTVRGMDPQGEISEDTLLTAIHRLRATGQVSLARPGALAGRTVRIPERIAFRERLNEIQIERAWQAFRPTNLVAAASGDVITGIAPRTLALLRAWRDVGYTGMAARMAAELGAVSTRITIGETTKPACAFTHAELAAFVEEPAIRATMERLVRFGVVADVESEGGDGRVCRDAEQGAEPANRAGS